MAKVILGMTMSVDGFIQDQHGDSYLAAFTFVTDGVESAIKQAEVAAKDRAVTVIGGASTARQCLKAGLVDELQIDFMPVLLGSGLRLFEEISSEQIPLERMKVMELPGGRTHLRFRIVK